MTSTAEPAAEARFEPFLEGCVRALYRAAARAEHADLATSVLPYIALVLAIFVVQRVSVALSLLLVLPAAGFLSRVFIVFHDCAHGSFLRSRRANDVLGAIFGALVWLPFRGWQHEHAVHHGTAGECSSFTRAVCCNRGRRT